MAQFLYHPEIHGRSLSSTVLLRIPSSSWGGGSIFKSISFQNKDEPILMTPTWKKTKNKAKKKPITVTDCQNVLQNNTVFKLRCMSSKNSC